MSEVENNDFQRASPEDENPDGYDPSTPSSYKHSSKGDNADKQKKRMRVPTSCSVCRKRKIRCDKQKPVCGACSKSNVHHLCHFEEPSWLNSEDLLKYVRPTDDRPNINPLEAEHEAHPTNINSFQPVLETTLKDATPNIINGMNINDLPPEAKKIFQDLTFRVKHLEASIAVHDLSNSYSSDKSNVASLNPPNPTLFSNQNNTQGSAASGLNLYSASYLHDSDSSSPLYDFNPKAEIKVFDYLPFMIKKTRLESHGPFSAVALMRKDVYLKVLWMHLWKTIEKTQASSNGSGNPAAAKSNQDPVMSSCISLVLARGGKSLSGFLEMRRQKIEQKAFINDLENSNIGLDNLIIDSLPNKKTIMVLCFRFFKNVYPFLPFVNENSFFTEIDAIIGPLGFNNDKIRRLHISSKYDYATLGLLLLVLRFAYLSISDEEFDEVPDFKILKTEPIGSKIVYAINRCLYHYKFMRKSYSLKVIQLFLYFKLYYRYCTEDDDVSDCSEGQIMLGTLFSMAYHVGFNRDPIQLTKLTSSTKKKPQAQLWRRIWHKLLELDCVESVVLGTPLHCRDDSSYDTPLPLEDQDDDEVDTFITQDFKFVAQKNQLYRDICNSCLNVNKPPTILEIIHLVKRLESFIQTKLGSMKDIVNDSSLKPYIKVKKISYLLEAHSLLLSLNLEIFRHFIDVNNPQKILAYLEECLILSLKISNSMMNLAYNEKYYYGKGFSYYLSPMANNALSKSVLFLSSFSLNVLHAREIVGEGNAARFKIFTDLSQLIFTNLENILQLMDKLCSKQYNFARVVMAFRLFYYQLRDAGFSFEAAATEVTSFLDEKTNEKLSYHHLHDLTLDEIPKSNYLMNLLETEISFLMTKCQTDLVTILQPAITKSRFASSQKSFNAPSGTPTPVVNSSSQNSFDASSFSSSGTFYDPINGTYQKKNSTPHSQTFNGSDTSSPSNPSPLTSASINFDNIFEDPVSGGPAKLSNPSFDATSAGGRSYDPNILTSEEYASLFGLFEDYNAATDPPYGEI